MGNKLSHPMLSNRTAAAWTSSPLETCLDRLRVREGTVSESESRVTIMEAEVLGHPYMIITLTCTVAILGVITVLRLCWHIRVRAVAGAFTLDLCPDWVLRQVWRVVVRWPFVIVFGQHVGPVAAEGLTDVVDQIAFSPAEAERFPSIHRCHPVAVSTFRSLPSGAVSRTPRESGSLLSSPTSSRKGSRLSVNGPVRPSPPSPPMPSSVITVFHSAKSRQVAEFSRSCTNCPETPATKKKLSVQPAVAFLSRHETINDVSISVIYHILKPRKVLD
jgi:hypothetical protein